MFRLAVVAFSTGLLLVTSYGCSDDLDRDWPLEPSPVTVVGEVTAIEDLVPVDGGVTILLRLQEGDTEVLLFGSLFTNPPPSEERFRLYEKIGQVAVGARVKAVGKRVSGGIELEDLIVLNR